MTDDLALDLGQPEDDEQDILDRLNRNSGGIGRTTLGDYGHAVPLGAPSGPADTSAAKDAPELGAGGSKSLNASPIVTASPQNQNALDLPSSSPELGRRRAAHEAEYDRVAKSGSGISQLPRAARIPLRILDTLGSVISPATETLIPGTESHHRMVLGGLRNNIEQDIEEQEQEARTANLNAQPEIAAAKAETAAEKNELTREKNEHDQENKQATLDQQYRKLGLKRDAASGSLVPISYEEMTPTEQAVHDLKVNQAEAAQARAQLDKLKGDPNSPVYQLQLKRYEVAQQNAANAAKRLDLSTAEFSNKLNEQELIKPSGQTQSRGSAAQSALDTMPHVIELIEKNKATMGPIMGRIAKGEIRIGDADPATQEVYAALQSLYALQPAVHGFRNAEIIKDFSTAIGNLSTNPEAVIGGLKGLKPTLEQVAKEGRTYHRRTVEGRDDNQGGAEPPRPANVPKNYIFKANGPKGAGWYKP